MFSKPATVIFVLLFAFLFALFSKDEKSKEKIVIDILQQAASFDDIKPIIPIIRKYPDIYAYVPIESPIKEKYIISSNFGIRSHPVKGEEMFHSGIDLSSEYAAKVHSTAKGKVIFAGNKSGYGKCVIIEHRYGFTTIYAHLTLYFTKLNKKVEKGDVIGFVGSTGESTGNHLHYEIKKNTNSINPIKWIN